MPNLSSFKSFGKQLHLYRNAKLDRTAISAKWRGCHSFVIISAFLISFYKLFLPIIIFILLFIHFLGRFTFMYIFLSLPVTYPCRKTYTAVSGIVFVVSDGYPYLTSLGSWTFTRAIFVTFREQFLWADCIKSIYSCN
jgi:hypothetical protein